MNGVRNAAPVALGNDTRNVAILNMDEMVLADRLAGSVTITSPSSSVVIKPAPIGFSLQQAEIVGEGGCDG